jgi:hypothetical protein
MFDHRAHDDHVEFLIAWKIVEIATDKPKTVDERRRIRRRIYRSNFVAHREHSGDDWGLPGAYLKSALRARREIRANPTPIDQLLTL